MSSFVYQIHAGMSDTPRSYARPEIYLTRDLALDAIQAEIEDMITISDDYWVHPDTGAFVVLVRLPLVTERGATRRVGGGSAGEGRERR